MSSYKSSRSNHLKIDYKIYIISLGNTNISIDCGKVVQLIFIFLFKNLQQNHFDDVYVLECEKGIFTK